MKQRRDLNDHVRYVRGRRSTLPPPAAVCVHTCTVGSGEKAPADRRTSLRSYYHGTKKKVGLTNDEHTRTQNCACACNRADHMERGEGDASFGPLFF